MQMTINVKTTLQKRKCFIRISHAIIVHIILVFGERDICINMRIKVKSFLSYYTQSVLFRMLHMHYSSTLHYSSRFPVKE
jgi:hypothetical protein